MGAVVGWVASMIMGTSEGLLLDIVVGIIGAVIGGWLMGYFGYGGVSGFNLYSFIVALLGAIILLAVVKAIRRV
ncbi:MAG: Transglycosylase-associated protein [Parcubacteria group bacterium GW2011_GWE2_38_18]|nr:MAG: Transglycosylase-associated protein [Parcubacteria group bacterium GW2011_GWE2_38_18]